MPAHRYKRRSKKRRRLRCRSFRAKLHRGVDPHRLEHVFHLGDLGHLCVDDLLSHRFGRLVILFEEQQKRGMDVFASVAASSEPPNGKMSHDIDKFAMFADDDDEGSVASTIMLPCSSFQIEMVFSMARTVARAAQRMSDPFAPRAELRGSSALLMCGV